MKLSRRTLLKSAAAGALLAPAGVFAPAIAQNKPLKIGVLAPRTGLAASPGISGIRATEWAVAKFNAAVSKALDNPALRSRFDALGLIAAAPNRRSPDYLRSYIDAEIKKWAGPVKASGLQVD